MTINILNSFLKQFTNRVEKHYRYVLVIAVITVTSTCTAQSLVTPMWPDRGMMLRDQLWNLSITNLQGNSFAGRIEVVVSDVTSGAQIFSGVTKGITINKGTNVITSMSVYPVTYSILSSIYNYNPGINSILPPGILNVCYKLYRYSGENVEIEAMECKIMESDPLSPPTLLMPENDQVINSSKPLFTWLPPVPNTALLNLNYTIKLVEKGNYQSPQEAIERNPSLFSQTKLLKPSYNYPVSLPGLDTAKIYAWQIVAYNDNSYVAASECWTFSLDADTIWPNKATGFYVPLINTGSSHVVNVDQDLRIIYNNEAADSLAILKIKKQNAKDAEGDPGIEISLNGGTNNIIIPTDKLGSSRKNTIYELYFINHRQERWWINFRVL